MLDSRRLSWCGEEVRRHDNDRFLAALFAPEPARECLLALYAFNIEVARAREAAREPMVAAMRLAWWRDALAAIYAGTASPRHPVADALRAAIERHRLSRVLFDRLLETRAQDLENAPHADMGSLLAYAEGTGATLAELALQTLQAGGDATLAAGQAVGTAWALVGILRAVPFHARARRLYLPTDRVESQGVSADAPFTEGTGPALAPVVRAVADEAHQRLIAARRMHPQVDKGALPVLLLARIADLYLARLAAAGYDPFDRNLGRPAPGRHLRLAFGAWHGQY